MSRLPGDGRAMRAGGPRQPIVLPDLSGVAVSVQRQVRERHEGLAAKLAEAGTPPVELADAFGDLGLVLMAVEYHEAAADCFASAMDLAPDEMRWPYYLGHLHAVRATARRRPGSSRGRTSCGRRIRPRWSGWATRCSTRAAPMRPRRRSCGR